MNLRIVLKILAVLFLILVAIISADLISGNREAIRLAEYFYGVVTDSSESIPVVRYDYGQTQPIALGAIKSPEKAHFQLKFRFRVDSTEGYPNLFQTAPVNRGMRMEISGSTAAIIVPDSTVAGGLKVLTLTTVPKTGQWYTLEVSALNGAYVRAKLDGADVVNYASAGLSMETSQLQVGGGSGFDPPRDFRGQIENISIKKGNLPNGVFIYSFYLALLTGLLIFSVKFFFVTMEIVLCWVEKIRWHQYKVYLALLSAKFVIKIYSLILLMVIAILGIYSMDSGVWIRSQLPFIKFSGDIRETINVAAYIYGKTPSIALGEIKNAENAYINLKLRFRVDSTEGYPNLFQTAPVNRGMRMEISGSTAAIIIADSSVLGGVRGINLTTSLKTGQWYTLEVEALNGAYVHAKLDGQSVVDYVGAKLSMEMSEILVGNGVNASRPFRGQMDNISVIKGHMLPDLSSQSIVMLYAILSVLITLFIFVLWIAFDKYGFEDDENLRFDFVEVLAICGWCLSLTIFGVFVAYIFKISKWMPHVLFLVSNLMVIYRPDFFRKNRYPFAAIMLVVMLAVVISIAPIFVYYPVSVIALVCFGVGSCIYLSSIVFGSCNFSNIKKKFLASTLIGMVGAVAWFSLFDLPNWIEYVDSQKRGWVAILFGFIALAIVLYFVYKGKANGFLFSFPKPVYKKLNLCFPIFHAGAIFTFFWLSFRIDTLFLGSSSTHWEYYVGPIRTIRGGGWLLWDTPSQYGFLNILLASLIPSPSSWQSLYIFQGALLFIVSSSCYFVAIRLAGKSLLDKIIAFLVILVGVFFADPDLIGPSLYPSSSVVRFFWCYVLILYLLIFPQFNYKKFFFAAVFWVLSVWWSAESAIYTSSLLFMAVMARLELGMNLQNEAVIKVMLLRYTLIAVSTLGSISVFIFLFYKKKIGVFPDIYSHVEHAFGYASGFGSFQIKWNGPIVFLALMFLGLFLLYVGIRRINKTNKYLVSIAGMIGCLWAISTYYIGRAYPNNVTAILPILGMMAYFAILVSRKEPVSHYASILRLSALPLIFLLVIPSLTPKFLTALYQSKSFSNDITNQMNNSDGELVQLMLEAQITSKTPISYYGNTGSMPLVSIGGKRFVSENTWLPSPLQLLEEPISNERRFLYMERFVHGNYRAGYLIQQNSNTPDRFEKWLDILNKFYLVDKVYKGNDFTIWHFQPR